MRGTHIALAAIVALALALRLWDLGDNPAPIHLDEAFAGIAAWRLQAAVEHARWAFFVDLGEFHASRISLVGEYLSMRAFGIGAWQLRLPSAIYGALSVVAAYALLRALADERAGLVAALLMATLHVPLAFARLGLPNTQAMLLMLTSSWLLVEALHRQRISWWAALGAVTALGLYSYLGFRAFLVVAPVAVALYWLQDRGDWRVRARCAAACAVALCVVGAPLVWRAARGDDQGLSESRQLNLINTPEWFYGEYGTEDEWRIFRLQVEKDLEFFTEGRDRATHIGWPGAGLDRVTLILAVAGTIVSLVRIRRFEHQFALVLFAVPFVGISLTESPPLSPRLLMTYPGIVALAALACAALADALTRATGRRVAGNAIVAALLIVPAVTGPYTYFARYDVEAHALWPMIEPHSAVGRFAQEFDGRVLLVTEGGGLDAAEPHLAFYDVRANRVDNYSEDAVSAGEPVAFVFVPDNTGLLAEFQTQYPGGEVRQLFGRTRTAQPEDDVIAIVYVVPAR